MQATAEREARILQHQCRIAAEMAALGLTGADHAYRGVGYFVSWQSGGKWNRRPPRNRWPVLSAERARQLRWDHANGFSLSELARRYDVGLHVAEYAVKTPDYPKRGKTAPGWYWWLACWVRGKSARGPYDTEHAAHVAAQEWLDGLDLGGAAADEAGAELMRGA